MYPTKKLWEVCDIWPKKSALSDTDWNTEVSFVPMRYLEEKKAHFNTPETKKLSEVYGGYTYFENGDVLLAKVTPCFENGKSWVARNLKNWIWFWSSEFYVLRPNTDSISPEYLYKIISDKRFLDKWAGYMSGAVWLRRVTRDFIEGYEFPLPSLPTQSAIVARLDAAFANIDGQIALMRASIEEAGKLRESILNESFSGDHPTKKLPAILSKEVYSVWKVKTQHYLQDGKFPIVDQGKSLIGGYSDDRGLVYSGKLPVLVYWDHTNVVKYVDFPFIQGADGTKILSFDREIDTRYAYYLINFFKPETQGYRRHFSILKEKPLPLPSLPIQSAIVARLDAVYASTDALVREYEARIADLEGLRRSLLHEAFEGRLVAGA